MIGLVLGDTYIGNLIIKKLRFLKKDFIIIDISKKKLFKKQKNSFPLSIGQLGKCISILKNKSCNKVLFAGRVERPNFYKVKFDFKALYHLAKIIKETKKGDAYVINFITKLFEKEGFKIVNQTFFNPELDPLGSGYHLMQSKIALGSGGFFGKGFFNGTQSKLGFVPEHSTDFILTAFGEEFGFMGIAILMLLYLFIALRGLSISIKATDNFGRILSGTLSLTLYLYVLVNVGMVIGFLPVVGAPLPFMSYGGTSMVTLFATIGIIMSIKSHQRILRK